MTSIRRFLILVLLLTIAFIIVAAAWLGYRNSMAEVGQLSDQRLEDIAAVLAEAPPGFYRTATGDNAIAFQIWENGELEAASANIPENVQLAQPEAGYSNVRIGGFEWRTFARYVPDSNRWIIVAESTDIRNELADNIVLDSVVPIVLGLPLCALLIWLVVGRGLRPLDDLAKAMRAKRSDDLSPVTGLETPQELSVLTESINDLLQRLDASFERERQFAADAAHELRTPVSVLKLQLHNLIKTSGDDHAALTSLQDAVDRLGHSVEQVLMLYRLSPDQFATNFETLDLAELARETIADIYPQIEARHQSIELTGEGATLSGDAFAVQTLLSNLIENASRYSGDGGQIRVTTTAAGNKARLTVEDSGPGIPADQRERVFERFYRGDSDAAPEGTGIGLAIVKNIADIHGATISLGDSTLGSGLAVTVVFKQ